MAPKTAMFNWKSSSSSDGTGGIMLVSSAYFSLGCDIDDIDTIDMFRFLLPPDGVSLKAGVACQEFVHLRQIQGGITWKDWDLEWRWWKIGTSNDKHWHKTKQNIKQST